ncbi:MAG: tRNA guanosine(34) transglycosylase Tgt [Patescibacteria group bacterium]|jgi:queuine tRNA-ribosyltransferase
MEFEVIKKSKDNKSRLGLIKTAHGEINTPVFMPVGTVGAVKGISPQELNEVGAEIILGNTYHLYLRPGEKLIKKMGGLQKFNSWNKPILTDSGGYQVFSLGKNKFKISNDEDNDFGELVKITDEGVEFKSFIDGSKHFFSPEKVIDIQLDLGSDIIMPLDYCPSAEADKSEIERAVDLTNIWFERAYKHFHKKMENYSKGLSFTNKPALFCIVQGGVYKDLREKSFKFLSQFDVDGYAIGGVANAGESKEKQHTALQYTLPLLPEDKPRYLMGVGEPEDLIYAIGQGIDMFDCVLPTRLGRHGTCWVISGILNQKHTVNFSSEKLPLASRSATPDSESGDHARLTSDTVFDIKIPEQLDFEYEKIDLRKAEFREDTMPIMKDCGCYACCNFSRSYIHHLIKEKEMLGIRLTSIHNLYFLINLVKKIRKSI